MSPSLMSHSGPTCAISGLTAPLLIWKKQFYSPPKVCLQGLPFVPFLHLGLSHTLQALGTTILDKSVHLVTQCSTDLLTNLFSSPAPVHSCARSPAKLVPLSLPHQSPHLYSGIQFFLLSWRQFGLTVVASISSRLLCDWAPRDFILYNIWPQLPLGSLPPPRNLPELSHAHPKRAKPYAQERTDMLGPGPQLGAS